MADPTGAPFDPFAAQKAANQAQMLAKLLQEQPAYEPPQQTQMVGNHAVPFSPVAGFAGALAKGLDAWGRRKAQKNAIDKENELEQGRAQIYAKALQPQVDPKLLAEQQDTQTPGTIENQAGSMVQPNASSIMQAITQGGDPKMIGPALAEALRSSMDRDAKANEPISPFQRATMAKQAEQFDATRLDTADSRLMQAQQASNQAALQRMQVQRAQAAEVETERHNRELEGKPIPVAMGTELRDPKTGKVIGGGPDAGGVDPSQLHGDDFLKTLAPADATEVKAMAEGRLAFPTGMSLSKLQPLIQKVGQYDPTFDAVNYNARSKTRAAFTGAGKEAQNLSALSTAILHAGQLYDQIDNVAGHAIPVIGSAVNAAENLYSQHSGIPGVTNYENNARDLSDEVTRAFRQAGGSESEIQGRLAGLSKNLSKADKKDAISGIIDRLMSRTDALGEQYKQGMGTDKIPIQLLSPAAQAQIKKIQAPVGAPKPQAGAPDPQAIVDELRRRGVIK